MSKIKKCLIILIISIISLIALQKNVKAVNIDLNDIFTLKENAVTHTVGLSLANLANSDNKNLYCIQHDAPLSGMTLTYYSIDRYVHIHGNLYEEQIGNNNLLGQWKTNNYTAILAYLIYKGTGYGSGIGLYSDSQRAMYGAIVNWDGRYEFYDGNGNGINSSVSQTPGSEQLIKDGTIYANTDLSELAYIKDMTDKDKITQEAYTKDDESYIRIGPFNWEFSGTITSTSVKSDNGEISDVLYSKYVGKEEQFISNTQIVSKEDFYITIKPSTNHTVIKTIDAKVKVQNNDGIIDAYLWFLSHNSRQNLLLATANRAPVEDEAPLTSEYDIKLVKDLVVYKVDADNNKIKLSNVGFKFLNVELNKYVKNSKGKISYVDSVDKATEFCTDENGEIHLEGILMGTYKAYETQNNNYGYVLSDKPTEIEIDQTEITIKNKQKYIKLSGYVWKDMAPENKTTTRNNLYKTKDGEYNDGADECFNGITVRLMQHIKDEDGNITGSKVIKTDVTKDYGNLYTEIDGGEYLFEDVLIDKLEDYYVEFEYDGLIYQSVLLHIDKERGSKATDEKERDILDRNFASVDATGKNEVNVNNGKETAYTIYYNDTKDHETSIKKDSIACVIHANTYDAKLKLYDTFKTLKTNSKGETIEEIRNVNLGLYEKPQADLSLTQDLYNVNVGVNGYWHVYNYNSRNLSTNRTEYDEKDKDTWNVGVKFKNSYTGTYRRAIYEADKNYKNDDTSKELQVYLTYKIALTNESSYLTRVNSIVDYFDSRYEYVNAGTGLDSENNITGVCQYKEDTGYTSSKYKKYIINVNSVVESAYSNIIYVQFKLNKEAVVSLMNNTEDMLYNKAEITSYTVFKDKNSTVAAVDRDSVPGNTNIDNIDTYEDDTDSAPPIQLELTDARAIQGTVFVDNTTVLKNGTRQGDGIYDKDVEQTLEGVEVKMTYIGDKTGTSIQEMKTITDKNGYFEFSGYVPGRYIITYTWGDNTYTVQNYKGTIYNASRYTMNAEPDLYWYRGNIDPISGVQYNNDIISVNDQYSDAIDNYEKRLEIDSNMAEITDATIYDEIKKAYNGEDSKIIYTKMDSITPTMEFSVEYDTNVTDGTRNEVKFIVKNVDFGIAERAKQQLDMEKRVKSFKITLANGQVLVDATVDENGKLQGSHDHVTYMGPNNFNDNTFNGYIKAEMDSELIEGSTLEIGYEIKFINNSEVDYMSENYYKYGTIEGSKVVTLTPSAVVDYLDKDLAFDASKNSAWKQLTIEDLKEKLGVNDIADANLVAVVKYEDILNTRTILYTEKTAQPIEPGGNSSVELNVSKLVTTSDDLTFDNDAETVKIDKPSEGNVPRGRVVPYFPEDSAPPVIITPSTGDDRAYVVPTIVGITSLLILSIGIFVIKKTVIDNK